jgi:RimJ/RimL family protein N-acetyltransferase
MKDSKKTDPDSRPTLTTERLVLRPFQLIDANRVQTLAGNPKVAATTASIPHPYPDGAAEAWIGGHPDLFKKGVAVQFAIILKETNELIGCISLVGISKADAKAEIAYWIGFEYWNKGYCSEAAQEVVKYGFERMDLNKITSRHASINPASGRVMLNAGLKKEGVLRQEFRKDDQFLDIEVYGILREDF